MIEGVALLQQFKVSLLDLQFSIDLPPLLTFQPSQLLIFLILLLGVARRAVAQIIFRWL